MRKDNQDLKASHPRRRYQRQHTAADRLPPHAPEAEQGVLGCVMLAPQECLGECVARLRQPEAFYEVRNQTIFRALVAMWDEKGAPIEVVTLIQWLRDRGELEEAGGFEYVASLPDRASSTQNLGYYLGLVEDKWRLRRMLKAMGEGALKIREEPAEVDECLDGIEAAVLEVNNGRAGNGAVGMLHLVKQFEERVETMRRGVGLLSGIRTHFGHLDKWTAGLHPGQLLVLAARPSLGKTSLALNMGRNVAMQERLPVGVFSMEMTADELTMRLMCAEANVDSHHLRTGFPSHEDLEALAEAGRKIRAMKLFIDDTRGLGILDLRARARRMVAQHGIRVLIVDYLQLMHGSKDYNGNRAFEVAEISAGLKSLAKELDVALVALSQLNRETERNKSRKPQLADLRESGAIEQDADTVLLLYRPKSDEDDDERQEVIPVNALISKQRNGPSDWDVEFMFFRKFTRFEDAYHNRGRQEQLVTEASSQPPDRTMPTNAELGLKTQRTNHEDGND
jgi:replicative DNA helicase